MACHEIAALRLGLMNVLGIEDEAEKQHDLEELGELGREAGPLKSLSEGQSLDRLLRFFSMSLVDLQEKIGKTPDDDPQLPYYKTLIVLTRKVEQELQTRITGLEQLYRDLDDIHHFVHEIYPAK